MQMKAVRLAFIVGTAFGIFGIGVWYVHCKL